MVRRFITAFTFAMVALLTSIAPVHAVDANTADEAQLQTIKGIGPAISARIVAERKKGNFKDWADFQSRVNGVGDKASVSLSQNGLTVAGAAKANAPPMAAPAKAAAPTVVPAPVAPTAAMTRPSAPTAVTPAPASGPMTRVAPVAPVPVAPAAAMTKPAPSTAPTPAAAAPTAAKSDATAEAKVEAKTAARTEAEAKKAAADDQKAAKKKNRKDDATTSKSMARDPAARGGVRDRRIPHRSSRDDA